MSLVSCCYRSLLKPVTINWNVSHGFAPVFDGRYGDHIVSSKHAKSPILSQVLTKDIERILVRRVTPQLSSTSFEDNGSSGSDDVGEYSQGETSNMRDLIISLSMEKTDNERRVRLQNIFHEVLDGPNGSPKRFTDLFDRVLAQVGDEIQMEARKRMFEDDTISRNKTRLEPNGGTTTSRQGLEENEQREPSSSKQKLIQVDVWLCFYG